MVPRTFRVERARRETHDTSTLELTPGDGRARLDYLPGQFNMLYVFGKGEVPISISGDPSSKGPLVHTVRDVGAVSGALRAMKAGEIVGVRGPYGSHWPVDDARGRDVIFLAGGIGLAPLRPALYHVLARREEYNRVVLLYGARRSEDLLYRKELEKWRGRFDLEVEVTVDAGRGRWRGNVGVVTKLVPHARFDPEDAVAFVCGPEVMMRYGIASLLGQGMVESRIHLTMERNMQCAVGLCGHCQFGPTFVCQDGPVFRVDRVRPLLDVREI
jgi:NAD(P)H-flavin reductase